MFVSPISIGRMKHWNCINLHFLYWPHQWPIYGVHVGTRSSFLPPPYSGGDIDDGHYGCVSHSHTAHIHLVNSSCPFFTILLINGHLPSPFAYDDQL